VRTPESRDEGLPMLNSRITALKSADVKRTITCIELPNHYGTAPQQFGSLIFHACQTHRDLIRGKALDDANKNRLISRV